MSHPADNEELSRSDVLANTLLNDLDVTIRYASRAGVVIDPQHLTVIDAAHKAVEDKILPDIGALNAALCSMVAFISPVTLADLHDERRDPFSVQNQLMARRVEILLTLLSVIVLFLISWSAHYMRLENDTLRMIERTQQMEPRQKLTEVRKLAQGERPLAITEPKASISNQYHQKVLELVKMNAFLNYSRSSIVSAVGLPLVPWDKQESVPWVGAGRVLSSPEVPAGPNNSYLMGGDSGGTGKTGSSSLPQDERENSLCDADGTGALHIRNLEKLAEWMREAVYDRMNDFCFQLKVVSPEAGASNFELSNTEAFQARMADRIRATTAIRTAWVLPFLYGTLGAMIFVMRNVMNIRTPAMEAQGIIMRIVLGGIAGVVVGWFAVPPPSTLVVTSAISLPFALAFLAGFAIDLVFTILDRAHKTMSAALHGAPGK